MESYFNGSKEKVFSEMPSGTKIVYSTVEGRRFNEGYKDKKRKRSARIAKFLGTNDKPKFRRKYKDESFNIDYIKEKESYYDNQLDGCLEYLNEHFNSNKGRNLEFLWISDLTILYKCIIKKLRGLLIKLYLQDKLKGVKDWNFKLFSSGNTFYLSFEDNYDIESYIDNLKEKEVLDEDIEKYRELSKMLIRVEKNLNHNNINFKKRTMLTYATILKYGK